MKSLIRLNLCALALAATAFTPNVFAEDTKTAEVPPVPDKLTTCVVSDEKLGSGGMEPFTFNYKNQEVKLCCKSCKKKFDKDPEKYLAKIRAADKK